MGKMTKAEVKTSKNNIREVKKGSKSLIPFAGISAGVALCMLYEAGGYNFTGKGKIVFWVCVVISAICLISLVAGACAVAKLQYELDKNDSSEEE